jgi:hypothetical protein
MSDVENMDTFAKIHEALCQTFEKAFPGFHVYREYPRGSRSDVELPAIFNELVSLDMPRELENAAGNMMVRAEFETRILIATKRRERRSIWALTARAMSLIRESCWGLGNVYPAVVTSSMDDGVDPENEGFEVWKISWFQDVTVLEHDLWEDGEFVPSSLTRRAHIVGMDGEDTSDLIGR